MIADVSPVRLRRSVLYVPASNARALARAKTLDCDAVIVDLEDSVLPERKDAARAEAIAAVAGGFGGRETIVRVNGADTSWGRADLDAVARSGADAVLLPKVDSAHDLRLAVSALDRAGAPRALRVWAMAETARGVGDIARLAGAHDRLGVLVLGMADLAKSLQISAPALSDGPLLGPAVAAVLLAARAHGLDILDGVYTNLEDRAGFAAACRYGKTLGFDGKTLIHPGQIATANATFGVSAEAAAAARAVIAAWEAAAATGQGVAVLDGRMIERLHADDARRTLALRAAVERVNRNLGSN